MTPPIKIYNAIVLNDKSSGSNFKKISTSGFVDKSSEVMHFSRIYCMKREGERDRENNLPPHNISFFLI